MEEIKGFFNCCPISIWHFSSALEATKSGRSISVLTSIQAELSKLGEFLLLKAQTTGIRNVMTQQRWYLRLQNKLN